MRPGAGWGPLPGRYNWRAMIVHWFGRSLVLVGRDDKPQINNSRFQRSGRGFSPPCCLGGEPNQSARPRAHALNVRTSESQVVGRNKLRDRDERVRQRATDRWEREHCDARSASIAFILFGAARRRCRAESWLVSLLKTINPFSSSMIACCNLVPSPLWTF